MEFISSNKKRTLNLQINVAASYMNLTRNSIHACSSDFKTFEPRFSGLSSFSVSKRTAYGTGRRYIFAWHSWLCHPPRVKRVREDAFAHMVGRKDNSTSSARSLSPSNSRKIDRSRRSYKTIPRDSRDGEASRSSSSFLT